MFNQMKDESKQVFRCIEANPGSTIEDIFQQTKLTKVQISSSLYTLWAGRYLTRVKGPAKNNMGLPLFVYTVKTETPRKKPRKKNPLPALQATMQEKQKDQKTEIEVLIAVKGVKDTCVLTLKQARDLVEQLKTLGV
jgi:hypothetical protein